MEDQEKYLTKSDQQKETFAEYIKNRGIHETMLANKMNISRHSYVKKKNDPLNLTWREIVAAADFFNITPREFIKKFLE